jgi:hypothetical protein
MKQNLKKLELGESRLHCILLKNDENVQERLVQIPLYGMRCDLL